MSQQSFNLVVFDWDGTLMDSESEIIAAMQAAMIDCDLDLRSEQEIRNIIGLGLIEAIASLFPEVGEVDQRRMAERYRYHFLTAHGQNSRLFPGVEDLLESLRSQGLLLAVATGKGRRGLNRSLNAVGLDRVFHTTRCADETRSKPHPQMLLEIIDEMGVMPSETLMVGDTEYDLQMSRNAGAHALAVSYGAHDKERLLACEPLACLDTFADLRRWFIK